MKMSVNIAVCRHLLSLSYDIVHCLRIDRTWKKDVRVSASSKPSSAVVLIQC